MKAKKQKMRFEKIGLAVLIVLFLIGNAEAVFINEIHYDNNGGDLDEGMEIAGAAGIDLAGWSIVFYNGNNGEEYINESLNGVLPDQQNGYGTLFFPVSGIQNGSPDGLALVDDGGSAIQFLSYEGSFTATNGPAVGMTSEDIGFAEEGNDAGTSLQLEGSGTIYSDFQWSGPISHTRGAVNLNQTFRAVPIPGAVWLFGTGLIGLVGIKRKRN